VTEHAVLANKEIDPVLNQELDEGVPIKDDASRESDKNAGDSKVYRKEDQFEREAKIEEDRIERQEKREDARIKREAKIKFQREKRERKIEEDRIRRE
jgi:hypothetical protein